MLRELHISNLAIIEDATLELGEGFNCFTGQTGAGKSLILGAFEILLGLRSGAAADMLRPGADEGRISGLFEIRDPDILQGISEVLDLTLPDGEPVLITRKLFASGRSSTAVNGQPVTAPMLREAGALLVDIHGQHDHQYLLRPSNQRAILDAFADANDLRAAFADTYAQMHHLIDRREQLAASGTLRRQQLDLYEFQAGEIDDAQLVEGEYDELKARHHLLANLGKLQNDAGNVHDALYDGDDTIVERLQLMTHILADLTELDEGIGEIADQVREATLSLQEAAFDLGRYTQRLELDPAEQAEIDDRLNTINRLASKYTGLGAGVDPVAELLKYRQQIEGEIVRLRGDNEDSASMDAQINALQKQLTTLGGKLSKARRAAAVKLKPLVERQLKDLGMAEAAFEVAFEPSEVSAAGLETLEMMVRTNPGQPARPLRQIASGGEMSRIMLALKSILARSDAISVLVFDEIDANIGGRLGTVIGRKLRALAEQGGHQVLCITHLPQIAAFAGRHLRIVKSVAGKGKQRQTRTTVSKLDGKARIDELAEMLAGADATPTTRKQARELLSAAD